ncbi:hypothetical protein [Aphanothece sacrum]|uniref:Maltooligosyl trehalose synthase n=1 Tax=Aphanothece sacrum FPU1 TaxID=1920663 RepID=A0A401IDD8_APHSA|nr:hypothetical protein [Aphanothece sacrum]GBF79244.1 maltooligosyl trehalose synthase [Aphanothece sacrum FPU1]GBF86745.1 maltooligosyl trehalose synthase [Aphanothece sacrum FPU3]
MIQSLIITLIIAVSFVYPGNTNWLLGLSITTFLTLIGNVCCGLAISSFVQNPNEANSILPLILLAQTVFAGVLFELKGKVEILANSMLSRWSIRAYGSLVDIQSLVHPNLKDTFDIYVANNNNLMLSWFSLIGLSLLYLGFSYWQLKGKKEY